VVYRLSGERVRLDLDGPVVEVEPIRAAPIQQLGLRRVGACLAASDAGPQLEALLALYEFVVREAQPSWDIADHLGPIPPTATGMARLPVPLAMAIAMGWLATLAVEEEPAETGEPASAVDAVLPPGPLRDEVKTRLRAVKAA